MFSFHKSYLHVDHVLRVDGRVAAKALYRLASFMNDDVISCLHSWRPRLIRITNLHTILADVLHTGGVSDNEMFTVLVD